MPAFSEPNRARTLGVVIVAAGSATRFGASDKVFAPLAGKPLVQHALELFGRMPEVSDLVLVLGPHTIERGMQLVATLGLPTIAVCVGGDTRAESVRRGIEALDEDITLVAVHDAARPLATRDLTRRVLAAARETGAAVPVIPVADTIHVPDDGDRIAQVLDRSRMRAAQTPQIARRDWLEAAYARADGRTDEGGLLFAAGYPVALVDGDPDNLKITWPRDLAIAEALLAEREREG